MIIDDRLISKLETLSRLKFNPEEKETIKKDLNNILEMFDKLNEVDTEDVEPLTYVLDDHDPVRRKDLVGKELNNEDALKNAEVSKKPFFAVPKFLKK